jgi:membrane protease subunit HflK
MFWKNWFKAKNAGSEMSWNEPGNGKDKEKDPWGGNNNQGPPDLDEAFKKLQDGLSKMFGGKGKGGGGKGGSSGPINPMPFVAIIVVVLVIALIWSSAYQVQQAEKAVVLRTGKFHSIEDAGLKFKFPIIDEVFKVNVQTVRSMNLDASMLTSDSNIVAISLTIQYQVSDPRSYLLEVSRPEESLHHATESALRHVVGGMTMDQVVTEQRQIVANDVKMLLQKTLNGFKTGILISEVSMQEANPPQQVKAAFDDVNKAKEDEVRLKNEAEAYSNSIVPVARGLAKRQFEEAEGYKQAVIARAEGEADRFDKLLTEYRRAPEVTRKRMYVETMQEVLSNTSKVMVDVEGGNNLLYLPLDKLMNQKDTGSVNSQAKQTTNEVLLEAGPNAIGQSRLDRIRNDRDLRREQR